MQNDVADAPPDPHRISQYRSWGVGGTDADQPTRLGPGTDSGRWARRPMSAQRILATCAFPRFE